MEPFKPQLFFTTDLSQTYMFGHNECPGSWQDPNPCFSIELDRYQYDDLERNGYTIVEPMCTACYTFGHIFIKLDKKKEKSV